MHIKKKWTHTFNEQFGYRQNARLFFATGRTNVIREHTDYNGGHVFPAAISFGTYAMTAKRTDNQLRFYSMNFPDKGVITCKLDDLDYNKKDDWANYPKGMIKLMIERGYNI